MSFFSKPESYLGVDLGAGGVKIVELRKEKNRPVLFTYGSTSNSQNVHKLFIEKKEPENNNLPPIVGQVKPVELETPAMNEDLIDRYAEVLKMLCKEAKTVSKTAVVSLPVSAVFHAIVTLPLVDKKDFVGILTAEIKKLLPRPIEEMAIDYQVIPGTPEFKGQKILVNAVPRESVAFYTRVFQKAGMVLDALEPESTALQRSLVGRDTAVTLLIDMGAERTNFFLVDQAIPVTHHSIETGGDKMNKILQNTLGIGEDILEQTKHDLSSYLSKMFRNGESYNKFLEVFMPVIDPIMKEVEYSFDLYLRQSGNERKRPEKIVLTGGAALLPGLTQLIMDNFKIKCYIGDLWARVVYQDSLKGLLNKIGPRMAVAIGLALRNVV